MSEPAGKNIDRHNHGSAHGDSVWGREVVIETVAGHPCRVYKDRRKAVAELLIDLERWHDRTSLVQGNIRLSYRELTRRVMIAADELALHNVGYGDRVLLLGYNSIEWLTAFLAAHVRHAVVVLGNAWWSSAEIMHAWHTTTPRLTIADERLRNRIPADIEYLAIGGQSEYSGCTGQESLFEAGEAIAERLSANRPDILASEDDPAVIMFTSGTMGAAKGVVLSNRAVIANLHNLLLRTNRLPPELDESHEGTVNLMGLPMFHIGGLQSTMSALLSGGRIVFLEQGFQPEAVLDLIETEKVSFWGAVPTMVRRVLDAPSFARHKVTSVRSITITGSMVEPELMERARLAFVNATERVGSVYGLTEAGGILTAASGREINDHPGSVGKPLPVVELAIDALNSEGVGEILARSPSVMSGYWSDDSPDGIGEDGWLRTGDLGRLDQHGFLYITGRSKDIIIRGGENVAAAHVEACLLRHPDLAEAAVIGLPHPDLGEEVAAVVVSRPGRAIEPDTLRQFTAEHLAWFERPTRIWVRTDPLPTNNIGKVEKARLKTEWARRSPGSTE